LNDIEDSEKRVRQREISHRYINRPVDFLIKHNFTPNKISFIGFFCLTGASLVIAVFGLYFSLWFSWIIPCIMGIGGAMDLFDGEVARRTNNETQAGAFLDSNLDRLSDAIIVLCLIYGGLLDYFLGYIILFFVIMISYIRSRAENEGVNMRGIGFMERAERLLFLIFAIIGELIFYFISSLILGEPITILIPFITRISVTPIFLISILIYTITLVYTIFQRLCHSYKTLKIMNQNNLDLSLNS
jgi:archaetidylinositol phosphate synthase